MDGVFSQAFSCVHWLSDFDTDCLGGNPLLMLFIIRCIGDYQGGTSLLDLGDIVLPGLLLSFGACFDAAKSLVRLSPALAAGWISGNKGRWHYGCAGKGKT
eukprot:scaffold57951_cov59-Attheya_sp.AAC.6